MVGGNDIVLWLIGVMGDRNEDCEREDWECISPKLEEFFRVLSEVVEPDLSLREKRPMFTGLVKLTRRGRVIVNEWMISNRLRIDDLREFSTSERANAFGMQQVS
jgi:hypothetical protein